MEWTIDAPFQALSLAGGGYRGLYTAKVLQVMEVELGKPIGQSFDLVSGTSIGGLLALAVAFEVPMNRVIDVFSEYGEYIFPPASRGVGTTALRRLLDLYRNARKPRYEADRLRSVVSKLIPKDAILGDALHPVLIPAVNLTEGRPQVFKTRHLPQWNRDWKYKVVDIALATAAAPTFFELAEVDEQLYADGGLFANAPDLIALHEAEHFLGVPSASIRLLSVGTTTEKYSVSFKLGRRFGVLDWMAKERLFSVIISSQQQFVDQLVRHRLGANYLRIDSEPSNEQINDLGLDVADVAAQKSLLGLGSKAATDVISNDAAPYLNHKPQLRILKDA